MSGLPCNISHMIYQFSCTEDRCTVTHIGYTTNPLLSCFKYHCYASSSRYTPHCNSSPCPRTHQLFFNYVLKSWQSQLWISEYMIMIIFLIFFVIFGSTLSSRCLLSICTFLSSSSVRDTLNMKANIAQMVIQRRFPWTLTLVRSSYISNFPNRKFELILWELTDPLFSIFLIFNPKSKLFAATVTTEQHR